MVYQETSQNPIRATPTLKATGSTPAGCTSEKALRFLKKSQGFRYLQYQFKGLWCTIPFAYFFKQQRKRDPARNRARMVARDQQNPLSRLGQCRKTSGINRRRNCSANNFRLFARFRHRFRHQNAGQTMILNMENLPASSVGNLYTPPTLSPLSGKNPALQTAFRHFLCPKRKGLHCRISFMLVPHRLKVRSNH